MTYSEGLLYSTSLLFMTTYLGMALGRSEFGLILLTYDVPFFLGCCIYPLLLGISAISPGIEGQAGLSSIGMPSTMTALHVFAFSGGTLLGYIVGRDAIGFSILRCQRIAEFLVPDVVVAWRVLIVGGLAVIVTFMIVVGVDVALLNAALARAGTFEGFEEDLEWLFLKRLAGTFGLVFVFVPAVLMLKTERPFVFVAYVTFIVLLYLNSISRVLLIQTLALPVMIYLYMKGTLFKPRALLLVPIIALFVAFVIVYGKGLGSFSRVFFVDTDEFELIEYQSEAGVAGVLEALLRSMEGQWYSIAAGIKHFADNGPFIPPDVIAAVFGFVPNRVLALAGLDAFHYSSIEPRLACVNNAMLGLEGCTLPPFTAGYSAYLFPVAAGFIFAFIKTWLFGRFEAMWISFRPESPGSLWFPFLGVHLTALAVSFIPVNLAVVVFIALVVSSYASLKFIAQKLPSLKSA